MSQAMTAASVQARSKEDEIFAASRVYRSQLDSGNTVNSALVLATIVYLQRNPRVPTDVARARVAAAIGAKAA